MTDERTRAEALRTALVSAQPDLTRWANYYAGKQSLAYLAPELERELEGRIRSVIVNWPRLVVDSLEERLDVEGFRLDGDIDGRLWDIWQANDLDESSQQAHVEALSSSRAYVIVGSGGPDGLPLITVESPSQVITSHDPRTRAVSSALKLWRDEYGQTKATLYLPDRTVWLAGRGPAADLDPLGLQGWQDAAVPGLEWDVEGVDVHRLGVVPVVPIVNRRGIIDQRGVSELADIAPLSDAACKAATDMMISAEFHAIPRRWIVGMSEADMVDAEGRPLSQWDRLAGRVWAVDGLPSEVSLGQWPEADLRNFHETLNSLARMVAAMAGLPPHFLGYSDANPASADAIRSAETRLVKRAERRQRAFGAAWEQVMRLALLVADGSLPEGASRLETVWRDASTPTVAQRADAVVKLRAAGIIPLSQARADLGYSAEQIELMEAEDRQAAARILAGDALGFMGPQADPVGNEEEPPVDEPGADEPVV